MGGEVADGGSSDRRKRAADPFFCRKDASGTLFIQEQLAAAEVERYYRKAKEILAQNQDFLERMASALVDRGLLLSRK